MDRALERPPVIVCSAALKTIEELQGYLPEQDVVVVAKRFKVSELEGAVLRALRADGRDRSPSARQLASGAG